MKTHHLLLLVVLAITGVLAAVVLGVVSINPVLMESHVITTGKFGNFTIGDSAFQTLTSIFKTNPVAIISPVPNETFVISRKNLSDVSHVKRWEGVSLFNYRVGPAIRMYFSDGRIYKIERVYGDKFPQFQIGDTISDTTDKLLSVLKSNGDVRMTPVVDFEGTSSYDVKSVLKDANSKLLKCSAWDFEVPSVRPAGAFYTLHFSNQRLYKIEYRRPRVRNDL